VAAPACRIRYVLLRFTFAQRAPAAFRAPRALLALNLWAWAGLGRRSPRRQWGPALTPPIDPKSPLRNSLHPEHAVALAKARVLAIIAEGKGRQGNVEELVKDRQDADAKAKGEPVDDATAKLDAEITAIRLDKGYSNPSAANHKALVARMQELMRQRWPD